LKKVLLQKEIKKQIIENKPKVISRQNETEEQFNKRQNMKKEIMNEKLKRNEELEEW